jgi:heptosyltransferase-2
MKKILIIRFSSFGDIVQAMGCLPSLQQRWPGAEIHWVLRSDFEDIVRLSPRVKKIWTLKRDEGIFGLIRLSFALRKEKYDLIYDAHSNLRSLVMKIFLLGYKIITRKKERLKRFLLFSLRINLFPKPYQGILSYIRPINPHGKFQTDTWDFSSVHLNTNENATNVVLVPSAAWEMKRWPVEFYTAFVNELTDRCPDKIFSFSIIGGPQDTFCEEILKGCSGKRIVNYAGKLTLKESTFLLTKAQLIVSADTGFLHVADLLGLPGIALIGPTAFGFPSGKTVTILESPSNLPCRPCTKDGRGRCSQKIYKRCMVEITPSMVVDSAIKTLL